jgi:hypothetical protein
MSPSPFTGYPSPEHAPAYAQYYIQQAREYADLLEALTASEPVTAAFIRSLSEEKGDFRYAEGKWSLKEVIAHINDTERIFNGRALRFSRRDATPVPGFEENEYAPLARANERSFEELAFEFETIRASTLSLFRYMTADMLDFVGMANGNPFTARSAGWVVVGHAAHHCRIIRERYL